jgi:leader peptidase (prepilin peptidase)/N-methyltransferase
MPDLDCRVRDSGAMSESMIVVLAVAGGAAGFVAGGLGRVLLRRLSRGVRTPFLWCECSVAALWAVVVCRVAAESLPVWWAAVPLLLGWLAVLLIACDVLAFRLPDALTLPAYPVALVVLAVAGCASGSPDMFVRAAVGAVVFAGTYALVRCVSWSAMGPGDVKLAGSLGAVVGAVSVQAVLATMAAAALLTVAASSGVRRAVPHGPAMLLPAWVITVYPGVATFRTGLW